MDHDIIISGQVVVLTTQKQKGLVDNNGFEKDIGLGRWGSGFCSGTKVG